MPSAPARGIRAGGVRQFGAPDAGHQQPARRRGHHGHRRHVGDRPRDRVQEVAARDRPPGGPRMHTMRLSDQDIEIIARKIAADLAPSARGAAGRAAAGRSVAFGAAAPSPARRRGLGIFATVDEAARAAKAAQPVFAALPLVTRAAILAAIRQTMRANARARWRSRRTRRPASGATKTRSSRTAWSPRRRRASRTCGPTPSPATTACRSSSRRPSA